MLRLDVSSMRLFSVDAKRIFRQPRLLLPASSPEEFGRYFAALDWCDPGLWRPSSRIDHSGIWEGLPLKCSCLIPGLVWISSFIANSSPVLIEP